MTGLLPAQAFAAFTLALLGGLHCAAMCGPIVGAVQGPGVAGLPAWRMTLGYHAGRLLGYGSAGLVLGLLGAPAFAADIAPVQVGMSLTGGILLLAIGLSMFAPPAWVRRLDPLGVPVWRMVQPWARRVFPPRSPGQAVVAGYAWGWIPCGMVYSALPLALLSGGAWQGGVVMLAFGAGTLPALATLGLAWRGILARRRLDRWRAQLRPLAGGVLLLLGTSALAHAMQAGGVKHPALQSLASLCFR